MLNGQRLASQVKFNSDYSRFLPDFNRYETWEESTKRVKEMNYSKFGRRIFEDNPKLDKFSEYAFNLYKDKRILASQRALQFGGQSILKHESKMYNCLTSYADRVEFFQESMYWLLSGCGIGFSVLPRFVERLPRLSERTKGTKTFKPEDSIEGWSDAIGVLISSFVEEVPDAPYYQKPTFPEYQGYRVEFDLSDIREKGAFISGGFKAPGPEPLRKTILNIERMFYKEMDRQESDVIDFRSILVYDTIMHAADAVIAGGVRRSATICIFDKNDEEMINAKTMDNFNPATGLNSQRARSNNSALLLRDSTTFEEFEEIYEKVKSWGEPGFIWTDSEFSVLNPCVEIGMFPRFKLDSKELLDQFVSFYDDQRIQMGEWISGWQGCNLTEINGKLCTTKEEFFEACKGAAILGTFQAGYTDFKYVSPASKIIFDAEALLGVSVTGWMNNPDVLFDPETQKEGARIVKETNKEVAELLGINQAARTTCVKPSGNASVILECASGIHGEHAPRYFRNMQVNKESDIAKLIREKFPKMIEESVWSRDKSDYVISFPVETNPGSNYKDELYGTKLLEYVKLTQANWVEEGTNHHLCKQSWLRHNVSNTVQVDDWENVKEFIYENREWFAGISLLGLTGDLDYQQAPFIEVLNSEEIIEKYGDGSMFASGLIVDLLETFDNNLWTALSTCLGFGEKLFYTEDEALEILDKDYEHDPVKTWMNVGLGEDIAKRLVRSDEVPSATQYKDFLEEKLISDSFKGAQKRDLVRRFDKFVTRYFEGDSKKASYCLKHVYMWHKWKSLEEYENNIDWTILDEPKFTDIDTLGSAACVGGACEIVNI